MGAAIHANDLGTSAASMDCGISELYTPPPRNGLVMKLAYLERDKLLGFVSLEYLNFI